MEESQLSTGFEGDAGELFQSAELAFKRGGIRKTIAPDDLHRAVLAGKISGQPNLTVVTSTDDADHLVVGDLGRSPFRAAGHVGPD